MAKLYEIASDWQMAVDFEITSDDDAVAYIQLLDEIKDAFENKAHRVCELRANLCGDIKAIQDERDRLEAREEALAKKIEWLEGYLDHNMRKLGLPEIEDALFTIKYQKNPPSVDIQDESQIPTVYYRIPPIPTPVPDKKAILEVLKTGAAIPGVALIQRERLVIK